MAGIRDRLRVGMDVGTNRSTSSRPTLIGRDWLVTPTTVGAMQTYAVPAGTKFVVARGVGAGGTIDGGVSADAGAGGGAYAKAVFPVSRSDVVQYALNEFVVVQLNGQRVFQAQQGQSAGSGITYGAGGAVLQSTYVTLARSGSSGSAAQGGAPGNDLDQGDTLYLTGVGATPSVPATGFGAGAALQQTSVSTSTSYPRTREVLVLEFWTGDPR